MSPSTVRLRGAFPRRRGRQTSLVAELRDAVFVEAEVVRQLVENGDPDLLAQLLGVREALLERDPVDRDRVGEEAALVSALRQRHAMVEAEEIGILGVLVLDDGREGAERALQVLRELVEGLAYRILEGHGLGMLGAQWRHTPRKS